MSRLLQVLRAPSAASALSIAQWNELLRQSRAQGLCARLSWMLSAQDLQPLCPEAAWQELHAQRVFAEYKQSQVRLELRKLHKALAPTGIPILLLKGAAYAFSGLRVARGRDFADLDIMLPRNRLEEAETLLEARGWQSGTHDLYDQRYYRRWMHELPPLRHRARSLEVDLHHALLPLTGRLCPDAERLWAASVPLPNAPYRVLSPEDMLLHSATQVFQDSAIAGELAALLDLHQLIQEFSERAGFWQRLVCRAEELDLGRPLHYALRFCALLLDSPIPREVQDALESHAPGALTQALMGSLVPPALDPSNPPKLASRVAGLPLYVRSHWLRMPPGRLAAHLLRKGLRGLAGAPTDKG